MGISSRLRQFIVRPQLAALPGSGRETEVDRYD
jgi:hypothetical protein